MNDKEPVTALVKGFAKYLTLTVLLPYDLTAFLPEDMGGDHHTCNLEGPLKVM